MGNIVIYDDSPDRLQTWKHDLDNVKPDGWCVIAMSNQNFQKDIEILFQRRRDARGGAFDTNNPTTKFDSADILFIDYDLIGSDSELDLTGEDVAYLLRCYSKCGYIVSVNQFRATRTFELTMDGHLDKFADLHISEDDLASDGLWKQRWQEFRPSTWSYLPDASSRYKKQIEDVESAIDEPLISFFNFPDSSAIADSLASFLDVPKKNFSDVTFTEFARFSTNALRLKDEQPNVAQLARIAAARIHKWLEHGVLPLQNVLVDAPHLALRLPSLFTGEDSVVGWDQLVYADKNLPLSQTKIKDHLFARAAWLSRPVWFWRDIQNNREIEEVDRPWEFTPPPFVFCEDISRFVPEENATEYDTGRPSSYSLRYIKKCNDVTYVPLRQLFT